MQDRSAKLIMTQATRMFSRARSYRHRADLLLIPLTGFFILAVAVFVFAGQIVRFDYQGVFRSIPSPTKQIGQEPSPKPTEPHLNVPSEIQVKFSDVHVQFPEKLPEINVKVNVSERENSTHADTSYRPTTLRTNELDEERRRKINAFLNKLKTANDEVVSAEGQLVVALGDGHEVTEPRRSNQERVANARKELVNAIKSLEEIIKEADASDVNSELRNAIETYRPHLENMKTIYVDAFGRFPFPNPQFSPDKPGSRGQSE
jgi:hypothetical protein